MPEVTYLYLDYPTPSDITDLTCFLMHHMRALSDEIIQKGGGEGLICPRVTSHYEPDRSPSLLKLKVMSYSLVHVWFLSLWFD